MAGKKRRSSYKGYGGYKRSRIKYRTGGITSAQRGYVRTGGNYGRYSGNPKIARNPEMKYFDTSLTVPCAAAVAYSNTALTGGMCLIAQGATENTRIGRKCNIRQITIKGYMNYTPSAAANVGGVAAIVYVILDRQTNGNYANAIDVVGPSTDITQAYRTLSQSQRFKVLKKLVFVLNPSAGVNLAYAPVRSYFEWSKKCNIPLEFATAGATITDLKSNSIGLLFGSDALIGAGTATITGNARLRFLDS